jgi:hypothetical protein
MELCILTDGIPNFETILLESLQPASGTVSPKAQEYIQGVTADMLTVLNLKQLLADPAIIVSEEG